MKIISTGRKEWENKHEIFNEKIRDLFIAGNEPELDAIESYNDCTRGFQNQLRQAIQSNTPYRSLGAGWSWSKIATAKDGIMMDTKQLNTSLPVSEQNVVASYTGDIKKLLFAQCGTAVWEISEELRSKKLSLKTSGASNGQTIVGAMSAGAHGSSFDVGAVQDYVVGLHIITGPDRHIWLERKSAPVVSASLIEKLQTELVQDDELFNAALVSFGSFGIIHGVMIETEDLFLLETYMKRMPYDDKLKRIMETLDFSAANDLPCGNERPFHFEVIINPYDLENGAYVRIFYKRPYREDYKRPVRNDAGIGPGDDAPCFIGKLTNLIPALVPTLVNKLLAGALKPYDQQFGTLGEIFSNTSLHGKLYSAAIGIPLNLVNRVIALLFEINKTSGPFPGLFAFRFMKKSKATIAFTRFDFTCIVELDGAPSDTTLNFYTEVWLRLEEEQIPFTFHWGKMSELNVERLSRMYGQDADAWIAARNKLLDAGSMKVFTNPLLQQWGLDKVI
ncbi:MAG: FAD-binding protein [Ferruginibacter sp.]|nr:FAD-binding protein [Ferruginibacter sp.]